MAVPKSKVSKQRRNKRRSSVWKLETPGVTTCPSAVRSVCPPDVQELHELQRP